MGRVQIDADQAALLDHHLPAADQHLHHRAEVRLVPDQQQALRRRVAIEQLAEGTDAEARQRLDLGHNAVQRLPQDIG